MRRLSAGQLCADHPNTMRVLVTGGSGYLGQFLLSALSTHHTTAYTYLSSTLSNLGSPSTQAFKVDLATGEGLGEAVLGWKPHVVINCAAIAQPGACEQDYAACRAVNCPDKLTDALQQLQAQHSVTALLIHISTDQVCTKPFCQLERS